MPKVINISNIIFITMFKNYHRNDFQQNFNFQSVLYSKKKRNLIGQLKTDILEYLHLVCNTFSVRFAAHKIIHGARYDH